MEVKGSSWTINGNKEPLFLRVYIQISMIEIMLSWGNALKKILHLAKCGIVCWMHMYITDSQFLLYSCKSVHISINTGVLFSQELCHCTVNQLPQVVSVSVKRTPCSVYEELGLCHASLKNIPHIPAKFTLPSANWPASLSTGSPNTSPQHLWWETCLPAPNRGVFKSLLLT